MRAFTSRENNGFSIIDELDILDVALVRGDFQENRGSERCIRVSFRRSRLLPFFEIRCVRSHTCCDKERIQIAIARTVELKNNITLVRENVNDILKERRSLELQEIPGFIVEIIVQLIEIVHVIQFHNELRIERRRQLILLVDIAHNGIPEMRHIRHSHIIRILIQLELLNEFLLELLQRRIELLKHLRLIILALQNGVSWTIVVRFQNIRTRAFQHTNRLVTIR